MVPDLRKEFNGRFTSELYVKQIADLEARAGCSIDFRVAETPIFLSKEVAARAGRLAEEILTRSISDELQAVGKTAIPTEWNFAGETKRPHFAAVDFAICGTVENPQFKLIELQGFPSLYHYQPCFSESIRDTYGLPTHFNGLIYPEFGVDNYYKTLKKSILAEASPENTVLLEIDPHNQKTKVDFYLAKKQLGIHIADISQVTSNGRELLFIDESGKRRPIQRIYNRTIIDELVRKNIKLHFDPRMEYDVEWAGHPNWYFRISKVLLPKLVGTNEAVPDAYYVSDIVVKDIDLSKFVLKPLYSFAGVGVNVEPTSVDIEKIPIDERSKWLLQEKVHYSDVIHTPDGNGVRCELRVLLLWDEVTDSPKAMHTLNRLTRGKMVGVDFNKGLDWVGSSCSLVG
jgi:hypothetical protein